jgi:hypothetical protein
VFLHSAATPLINTAVDIQAGIASGVPLPAPSEDSTPIGIWDGFWITALPVGHHVNTSVISWGQRLPSAQKLSILNPERGDVRIIRDELIEAVLKKTTDPLGVVPFTDSLKIHPTWVR